MIFDKIKLKIKFVSFQTEAEYRDKNRIKIFIVFKIVSVLGIEQTKFQTFE